MDDVHFGIKTSVVACRRCRVGCLVAAAIDVHYFLLVGAESCIDVDIDCDFSLDDTLDIAATEDVFHTAAIDIDSDIAGDCFCGAGGIALQTAIDVVHCAAPDVEGHVAGDVGIVRSAIDIVETFGAAGYIDLDVAGYFSLVATAEDFLD